MLMTCRGIASLSVLMLLATGITLYGQATGAIVGSVTDTSGAIVPNAKITVINTATNASRETASNAQGIYSAPSLDSGDYQVRVEVQGFRTLVQLATVQVGATATVDAVIQPGESREVVNVNAVAGQINVETNNITGQIEQGQLSALPLNGRSFLQLASLEPGVTVTPGDAQHNALFTVSVMGTGVYTVVTMDGGNVSNNITVSGGMTSMNFSQEMIQEFQISTVNFDISTPIAQGGAVNVVTRSGGNDFHGAGYFFYRDHNMAAYPNLVRLASNPNPYFVRKNPGFWVSGPIKRDKLFFFVNYEYQTQLQALSVVTSAPSLAPLQGIWASPFRGKFPSFRLDYHLSSNENVFFRYSHDSNINDGQGSAPAGDASTWSYSKNWADQFIMGVTSVLTTSLVNDFHFQYQFWSNHTLDAPAGVCPLPCLQNPAAFPNVFTVVGTNFPGVGPEQNQPQTRGTRRFEPVDIMTWQKGKHRLKFGGDLNLSTDLGTWGFCNPMCVGAWSLEQLKSVAPGAITAMNLPSTFTTDESVYQLPVYNNSISIFSGIGIGSDVIPPLYNNRAHQWLNQWRAFFQDVWKIRPNLTVNYGLAWNAETGYVDNDVPLPQYLRPIVGNAVGKMGNNQTKLFQPAFGFAWTPFKNGKTVIRGGGGIYWDAVPGYWKWRNLNLIGPPGVGRETLSAAAFVNTIPGVTNYLTGQPLPMGAPFQIQQLYNVSITQFANLVQTELPTIAAAIAPPNPIRTGPFPYSVLDYAKQGVEIFPANFPFPRSYQTNLGVQHNFGGGYVLSVDWARRQGENLNRGGEIDQNLWNRYQGTSTNVPVIPACGPGQILNPTVECSSGPITFWNGEGRSVYDGLLVKFSKSLSKHYQFTASYAFQKLLGQNAIYNELNWNEGYGGAGILAHNNLNIAGVVELPWGFNLSINSSIISRTPVLPLDSGLFVPGQAPASTSLPLPELNTYTLDPSAVTAAVNDFNSTYAGTTGANGAKIKAVALPPKFLLGAPLFSQDFRLTKIFRYKERYQLNVFAEMFNTFNVGNVSGSSVTIDTANANPAAQVYAFGLPTQRVGQTFGSGGPRAVQLGARISF
jgi:hypothetical protein